MTWIIMTTSDFPVSSGEGAGKDLWKLHRFSVPGSSRHQKLPQKKCEEPGAFQSNELPSPPVLCFLLIQGHTSISVSEKYL